MFPVLRHYGIPNPIVNAIKVLYSNSSSAVMVDGSISDPFDVTTGVLQGDVWAPFLFIIFVDYLLGKASGPDSGVVTCPRQSRRYPAKMLNDLDFADDIALLESSILQAQAQLTRTADAAGELGLVISAPKTEFMTIHCHPQPPLQVYGTPINHVTDFKYLGSMMASSARDLKRWKALAWTAFWKLERIWKSLPISISTKLKLFNITLSQYYYVAASHGSSLRTWRTKSILLACPATESCLTSGEPTGCQMLPSTAFNRISSPYWKSQVSTNEFPWSCAPLAWKWACQRLCHVCSYPWEEETRKTATLFTNYVHCLLGILIIC